MDAGAWIDLVIKRADDLRKAGVLQIGVDGASVTLGPLPIDLPEHTQPAAPEEYPDAFHDPATYPNGIVPGYRITRLEE